MSFLEFARIKGPVRHPTRSLRTITRSFDKFCGNNNKNGPTHCRVHGASYDALQASDQSIFEYLLLNATLELDSVAFQNAQHQLREDCPKSHGNGNRVYASPRQPHLRVELLRDVGQRHQASSCATPFDIYVDDGVFNERIANVSLPTMCFENPDLKALDDAWLARFSGPAKDVIGPTATQIDRNTTLCTLDRRDNESGPAKLLEHPALLKAVVESLRPPCNETQP